MKRLLAWCVVACVMTSCATFRSDPAPVHLPPVGVTVRSISHAYGFDQVRETGLRQVIGLVVATDDPTLRFELKRFDTVYARAGDKRFGELSPLHH